MNYLLISLGIVIAILAYVIYSYFSDKGTNLLKFRKMNDSSHTIAGSDLSEPSSRRYAYGFWTYLNSWSTTPMRLLTRGGFYVEIDRYSTTLRVNFPMSSGRYNTVITDKFPIQKWTYVVVSVDNDVCDVYIDGKLARSFRIYTGRGRVVSNPPSSTTGLIVSSYNGSAARIKQWPHPLNPEQVYTEYMRGSGQEPMFANYGMDVSLLRDNVEQVKVSLF